MKGFKANLKAKLLLTFWFSLNLIHLYFWKCLMRGDTFSMFQYLAGLLSVHRDIPVEFRISGSIFAA